MSDFQKTRLFSAAVLACSALGFVPSLARANVAIFDKDDWKISMGGFVATAATVDSNRKRSASAAVLSPSLLAFGSSPDPKSSIWLNARAVISISLHHTRFGAFANSFRPYCTVR